MRQLDDLTGQTFGVIHVDSFSHMRYDGENKNTVKVTIIVRVKNVTCNWYYQGR